MGSSTIVVSSLMQQQQQPSGQSQPANGGSLALAIIGSSTKPTVKRQPPTIITLNSTPYTANSASAFIIGTQTLAPGSPALIIDSTVYFLPLPSLWPAASGSSTPVSNSSHPPMAGEIVLTIASALYTCRQDAPCTIASQILVPNGTITVGTDTIVYGPAGIDVVRATTTVIQGSTSVSRGDVITSHIDGLTPTPENTVAAAARPETGRKPAGRQREPSTTLTQGSCI
ncbi:MAG: hypothetical protein L6R36_001875 [Xanthoria steineri]|nr:MAG: hypothetical protein L6R36_001875 [Xanthoria steineri]